METEFYQKHFEEGFLCNLLGDISVLNIYIFQAYANYVPFDITKHPQEM